MGKLPAYPIYQANSGSIRSPLPEIVNPTSFVNRVTFAELQKKYCIVSWCMV